MLHNKDWGILVHSFQTRFTDTGQKILMLTCGFDLQRGFTAFYSKERVRSYMPQREAKFAPSKSVNRLC